MNVFKYLSEVSSGIRALALKAMNELSPNELSSSIARSRFTRPVDYMRCAEYEAILRCLKIAPWMKIIDVMAMPNDNKKASKNATMMRKRMLKLGRSDNNFSADKASW